MIKLMIIGNLGSDATIKEISGVNYISYSVCHTDKGKDGKEFSTWVSVMQKTPDSNPRILPYLRKGTQVYVEGSPSVGAYVNKSEEAVGSLSLWAYSVQLLGSRKEQDDSQADYPPQQAPSQSKAIDYSNLPQQVDEDNLPF